MTPKRITEDQDYYRLRTREFIGSAGLSRIIKDRHHLDMTAFFQAVEVIDDSGRFVTDHYTTNSFIFSSSTSM